MAEFDYGDNNNNAANADYEYYYEPDDVPTKPQRRTGTKNHDALYGDVKPKQSAKENPTREQLSAKFKRHKLRDLLTNTLPRWLIRDLIFEQQVGVFFAPSGSYKTFVAQALCSMLAHGMEWQGRRLQPCNVIYMAGEGFGMFGLRRLAWFKLHGLKPENDGFEVIDCTVNLLDDDEVEAFVESTKDVTSLGLLVLDTLSTSVAGQDENASAVMTKAVNAAIKISRKLKCAVLIIHHPGKDEERGLRGHSSLGGNIDVVLRGQKIEDGHKVTVTVVKQKDGEADKIFTFSVHRVALGIFDDDGVEMDSLALKPCQTPQEVLNRQNDLSKIVSVMKLGEMPSIAQVAQRLIEYKLVDGRMRGVQGRVAKAISVEWMPVDWFGKLAEIRRVPAEKNGMAHKIMLRLAEAGAREDHADHAAP